MYKTMLIFFAILAVAKAGNSVTTALSHDSNFVTHIDDYINQIRRQYEKNIKDYDIEMDQFSGGYLERLDAVRTQSDMVAATLRQFDAQITPVQHISELTKQCINKYRSSIPTLRVTETAITSCILQANNQITSLLSGPLSTRNILQNYYKNYFEKEISDCRQKYVNTTANYTICVTSVTFNTNAYTISNQKTFNAQMDAAKCSAKANIKISLDCSYTVQTRTIALMTEADVLMQNCVLGKDECKPCAGSFTCPDSYDLKVDYKNRTIANPFYGREAHTGCLMLNVR